jgi:CubicO group peptidase (beta-lactamase class C family)
VHVLEQIDQWPSEQAAAGLVLPDGTVQTHGPVAQRFALASITKLFTATAALVAVEEGTLSLDVPDDDGITIADLLSHASGLDAGGGVADAPGRRRLYSNAGYERVAERLSESAGMPFATYLHEAVFQPLKMTASTLEGSPAHGGVSSVQDLLAFARGVSSLLAPETFSRMTTPHLPELAGILPGYGRQTPNPFGLGPEIRSSKSPHWTGAANSPFTWGHFGQAGTFLWVDPLAGATLVVLTNLPFGAWAKPLWPALSDAVLVRR